ncbi:MAG TPA: TIGR01777 family oxidoreductase [Gammaproteobacteria bacterium]|nr:TIGR01777 family oxidoreductase [Gammaproteobacteria bacterium]
MEVALALLTIQIALGAFDNLWHHEITEALPAKRSARVELALHAARELCYAITFGALAWWAWHGAWVALLVAVFVVEIGATLADFLVEDATRRLPKLERALHTVLAINFGAMLAAFAPTLAEWAREPTAVVRVDHGAWSWLLTACGAAVLAWSARNALAAARHFRVPAWQRRKLAPRRNPRPKRVLITGATGFIGRRLAYRLIERGDRVLVLARNPDKAADLFGPHADVVNDLASIRAGTRIDAIVNLAGAPIGGGLWTRSRKALLIGSRLDVTSKLLALVARLAARPTTWINASAIGYYGTGGVAKDGVHAGDAGLHEKSPPQPIFASELCRRWEQAATRAGDLGVKVALLRIGLVLGADGGALPALALPVRLRCGAILGTGKQWVSWIAIEDLLELVLFVLDQETLAGPVNATAPEPVTHGELMRAIAAALGRSLLPFAIPARLLRLALGELAQLFVDGQRVLPARAVALGFRFQYPTVATALAATWTPALTPVGLTPGAGERGEEAELPPPGTAGSATV